MHQADNKTGRVNLAYVRFLLVSLTQINDNDIMAQRIRIKI